MRTPLLAFSANLPVFNFTSMMRRFTCILLMCATAMVANAQSNCYRVNGPTSGTAFDNVSNPVTLGNNQLSLSLIHI